MLEFIVGQRRIPDADHQSACAGIVRERDAVALVLRAFVIESALPVALGAEPQFTGRRGRGVAAEPRAAHAVRAGLHRVEHERLAFADVETFLLEARVGLVVAMVEPFRRHTGVTQE